LTADFNQDAFVARYAPSGDLVWAKRIGGDDGGQVATEAIAALPDGSAFTTGAFSFSITFGPGEAEETTVVANGLNYDAFVARFDPAGNLVWVRQMGGSGDDWGTGLGVLADGTSLVGGFLRSDTALFDLGLGVRADLSGPGIFIAREAP
jgi:hypothetical protein